MANVPDDWGCYYFNCGACGRRCHASEGGCDCPESQMMDAKRPSLADKDYEYSDGEWKKLISIKTHVAKIEHNPPNEKWNKLNLGPPISYVKVGDTYECTTYRIICDESGEQHHVRVKRRKKKGPNWDEQPTKENHDGR